MVIAKFNRRGEVIEQEFKAISAAVRFFAYGLDSGSLAYDEIRDGERVIDGEELARLVLGFPLI